MLRERQKIAMIMAEFLGTAILATVVLAMMEIFANSTFLALVMGLTVAVLYMIFSAVSGAHLNPAITIALLTAGRIKALPAIVYVAAQLLGGMAAYALFTYLTDKSYTNDGQFNSRILAAEAAGGFVLALGWAAAVYNRYEHGKAAFVIGGALCVGVVAGSFTASGILNPAIALSLQSWVWGTYILGPVLGAIIGFNLYALLFAPPKILAAMEGVTDDGSASDAEQAKPAPARKKR